MNSVTVSKTFLVIVVSLVLTAVFGATMVFAADDFGGPFDDGEGDQNQSSDEAVDSSATSSVEVLGPYGGNTWDIAIDAENNMMYVTAKDSPNGVYRSEDGGETWLGLTGVDYGGGVGVEVDSATGTVFALFSNGLYRSTDLGETYTKISQQYGGAIVYANGVLMMADTESPGTIFVSDDNGDTFDSSVMSLDLYSILWMNSSPTEGEFYVIGYDSDDLTHLYVTSDNGISWDDVAIPAIVDNSWGSQLGVDPTDAQHLVLSGSYDGTSYQSLDGGHSWVEISPQGQSVAFDSTGRLFLGGQYTDDQGDNWVSLGRDENDNNTAIGGHALIIDPANDDVLYGDGMPGMSKSIDGGVTWTDINQGIAAVTITDISQADNKDIVWAAAYNGVAKTENFTDAVPVWEFPILPDPSTAIWTQPDNPDVVVVGELGAMKRSEDGGVTWSSNVVEGVMSSSYNVNQLIVDVDDANTLYAAVGNGQPSNAKTGMVLKSTDLGLTWTDMEITGNASGQTIAQASNGDLYVGLGAEGGTDYVAGIYKYSEEAWAFLTNSPDEEIVHVAVDPQDDNVVYAVASIAYGNNNTGKFGFYKSEDAGDTWTKITDGFDGMTEYNSLAIQESTTPATLYLGGVNYSGQGVLYKSSDNGDSWNVQYTGLKEETFYTMIFDGITVGSSRGLFDIKSKAKATLKLAKKKIKKGKKVKLTVTLKDAVTSKLLMRKKVILQKKVKSKYKKVTSKKTTKKGKATFTLSSKKAGKQKYRIRWNPSLSDQEEYTSLISSIKTLTVRK